ncbi:MAG: M56 family metallopeptidase, partial [Maricaulaceae bacterium]
MLTPSAAPAETSSSFEISLGTAVLGVWIAGALISLAICTLAQLRFHHAVTAQARRPSKDELGALFAVTAGTRLLAARDFRFTDQLSSPTATGLFRPLILLPVSFLEAYDDDERRVMVLHEAEHLRARHLAHRLAARLIRALMWFHPLAWIGERSFIVDQELACDSAVLVRNASIRPRTYAETLLKTASRIVAPRRLVSPQGALGAPLITIKQLKERTAMLERHVTSAKTRVAGAAAVVLLAGAAVLAGLTGSIAATDREPADPEDVAEAARAVAEAQAVLREREA